MVVHRVSEPKPMRWENIEVGEELGWVEGTISDFQIKTHGYAVDDYGDWYLKDSPFGGRIGHPTLLASDILRLFMLSYDMRPPFSGGLHAKNELELLRPVKLGDRVIIRGRHTEKYEKRGQRVRVLEGEAVNESGQPYIKMRAWETVGLAQGTPVGQGSGKPASGAITGEIPLGAPVVQRAARDVPVGAVLPQITKHTTLEQSIAFSGYPFGWVEGGSKAMRFSIHTDPEDARTRGAKGAIVQGLCSAAYISQLCTDFFGPSWLTTGRLNTAFIKPVIALDDITTCAMVRSVETGERNRIELDVWCKNQAGELTSVGWASAEL